MVSMNCDVAIVDSRWRHNCCHWLWLTHRTSHRPSNDAIWDLRHDLRRDLTESRWFPFVNTTWLGPSLKWDSVRVQANSWVKSQAKTVREYDPRSPPRTYWLKLGVIGWRPVTSVLYSFVISDNYSDGLILYLNAVTTTIPKFVLVTVIKYLS